MNSYPVYPPPPQGFYDPQYHQTFTGPTPASAPYFPPPGPPPGPPQGPVHEHFYPPPPPPRPNTTFPSARQHTRFASESHGASSFHCRFSPRYNSNGQYATATTNIGRKGHWPGARRMRSYSSSQRIPGVDSDDDEEEPPYVTHENEEKYNPYQNRRPTSQSFHYRGHGPENKNQSRQHHHSKEEGDEPRYQSYQPQEKTYRRQSKPATAIPKRPQSATPKRPHTTRPNTMPENSRQRTAATETDARRHRIPAGFSLKYWDPNERPIILLGSVFDADSLGRWIYDWTVCRHGSATPIAEIAAELWLLLITTEGKVKYAEFHVRYIQDEDDKDVIQGFISSGARLSAKLQKLLKSCEAPMLSASKLNRDTMRLGKNSGLEFVDSIFGRDRQLEATERYMASMRLWNLRFDVNCDEILSELRREK